MRTRDLPFRRLRRDSAGSSAVEFALLAPVFLGLMFGVVEVGVYMQNYNAVRTLAGDAARFATVQYQRNNQVSETTLEDNIAVMGIASPYNLDSNRLTVDVNEVTPSPVDGARQFDLDLSYALPDIIQGTSIDNITITYSRQMFVLD